MRLSRLTAFAAMLVLIGVVSGKGDDAQSNSVRDDLAQNFVAPPASARPHTWWHWMNGNVTKEGITADLEAMRRVGIGGVQLFNVLEGIPDGPIDYLSPQWLDLVHHAASESERLGLELCLVNCAGWSSSGGPWVKPAQAMQTVVTSETKAKGPARFDAALPQPATKLDYYRDIAVLAFPTPANDARIENLDAKALKGFEMKYGMTPEVKEQPSAAVIPREKIVDVTSQLSAEGKLMWDVPEGDWTILRIGHTPTGKENHPAPKPGRGLECDKLSREAFDAHWAGGVEPLLKHLGSLVGKSVNNCLVDSYEVGNNNWSPKFREEFIARRHYDPIPFLPALTGRCVGSDEMTERFLWDFRRTIGDLFAENYFGRFVERCHERGIQASLEPYDGPFECLAVGAKIDVIMGEFWVGGDPNTLDSVKIASSSANVHGTRIVGAESFTAMPSDHVGRWLEHPAALKALGDMMFCEGINRYIFHTYAHQPWLDKLPGMTMGQWGTHFSRTNTWWEQARAWLTYVARSQYLLQQGRTRADVLFFVGESSPNGGIRRPELKAKGYDYDNVGADLLPALTVVDGRVATPAGTSYRILVLPDTTWMTPATAAKIRELVAAGAIVLGPKPAKSPSLTDYPACDAEVAKIAGEVWGNAAAGPREFGKGTVYTGRSVEEVLAAEKVQPDFTAKSCAGDPTGECANLNFLHRVLGEIDFYLVSNQGQLPATIDASFRLAGRQPELWDAETGDIRPAPLWRVENGRTVVTLDLEKAGAVFVVFRNSAAAPSDPVVAVTRGSGRAWRFARCVSLKNGKFYVSDCEPDSFTLTTASGAKKTAVLDAIPAPIVVGGDWEVAFPAGRGAPAMTTFDKLISWPDHADPGIKYFSGTAVYRKSINIPADHFAKNRRLLLDLGVVHEIAEVRVNGREVGTLWKTPFRIDVTEALKPGDNEIEVRVTNLWVNRLIGDEQFPDDCQWKDKHLTQWPEWMKKGEPRPTRQRQTFTTWKHWAKDGPLLPSGLIGPVRVLTMETAPVE